MKWNLVRVTCRLTAEQEVFTQFVGVGDFNVFPVDF
jgi:hypothetical protein